MYLNTSKYRDRNRLDRRESYHSAMQSYTNNTPKYAASFPNVKSKDLVCTFCRKRFYYSQDLKATSKLPLLLPCGHLTCSNCEYTYASSPKLCPLCPYVKENLSRKNLSIHVHLVGLLKVISCVPPHMDDPDMTFQTPDEAMALKKMSNMDSDKDVCVNKCGSIATLKCVQCNIVLCKSCSNKIHDIALQWHTTVSLNVKAVELVPNFCTNHKTEASEYYCITCDYECCSHCIIQTHKDHETLRQTDRNEQLMPEFMEACEKLRETRIRTHRIFKKTHYKKSINIERDHESRENESDDEIPEGAVEEEQIPEDPEQVDSNEHDEDDDEDDESLDNTIAKKRSVDYYDIHRELFPIDDEDIEEAAEKISDVVQEAVDVFDRVKRASPPATPQQQPNVKKILEDMKKAEDAKQKLEESRRIWEIRKEGERGLDRLAERFNRKYPY